MFSFAVARGCMNMKTDDFLTRADKSWRDE